MVVLGGGAVPDERGSPVFARRQTAETSVLLPIKSLFAGPTGLDYIYKRSLSLSRARALSFSLSRTVRNTPLPTHYLLYHHHGIILIPSLWYRGTSLMRRRLPP